MIRYATRFPPYVFSTSGNAKLVHLVANLQLWWDWRDDTGCYQTSPRLIADTLCGQSFHGGSAQLCHEPNPAAMQCGRCQGLPPPFGRFSAARTAGRRAFRKALRSAHRKLVGKRR
jgi:hypothetical protein